jgi:hypothetical protein
MRSKGLLLSTKGTRITIKTLVIINIKHQWSSGRIVPCHGTDPGSIPGWCSFYLFLSLHWQFYTKLHTLSNYEFDQNYLFIF